MKILIISYFFPPLNSVASLRPHSFAKAFSDAGHEVTVLTAEKPSNSIDLDFQNQDFEVVHANSPLLARCYKILGINRDTRNPGSDSAQTTKQRSRWQSRLNQLRARRGLLILGRMPDLLDLLLQPTKRIARKDHWDVVLSTYAPRYCHAVAHWLRRNGRADFWVADYRDLWSGHHQFKGLFPFTMWEQHKDEQYLRAADLVTTVSADLEMKLGSLAQHDRTLLVPNGYDPGDQAKLDPGHSFEEDGKIRLVYTGTTYPSWGSFKHLLLSVEKLTSDHPELVKGLEIIFVGHDLARLEKRSQAMKIEPAFRFIAPSTREFALRLQRDAHVLLFFDPDTDKGIPTGKIYEYISSGTLSWRIGPPHETVATTIFENTKTGRNIGQNHNELAFQLASLIRTAKKPAFEPNQSEIHRYARGHIGKTLLDRVVKQKRNSS